jgi:hypothetical protein
MALRQLAEGNVTGGGGGDDDFAVNWFDIVSRKHMDELGLLIKAASKCLFPPPKGYTSQRQTKDEAANSWNQQSTLLKQQVTELRDQGDSGDQMLAVAKILNMKDKLLQQILAALLYKKTVIWTDLKINPGASSDNSDVIYAAAKIVQVKDKIDEFLAHSPGYLPSRYNYKPID